MRFWGMTHPDQVRALRAVEFVAMSAYAEQMSKP